MLADDFGSNGWFGPGGGAADRCPSDLSWQ